MCFTGLPLQFSGRNCHSGTVPSPEYTASGDYRSSAPGGSANGPSSRLTVADLQGPVAVSPQKCTRYPLKTGGLKRFHGKSARKLFPSVQSVDKELHRSGRILFNIAALQSEVVA